jgi:hypothetical protein
MLMIDDQQKKCVTSYLYMTALSQMLAKRNTKTHDKKIPKLQN